MSSLNNPPIIIEIPEEEKRIFESKIKSERKRLIRSSEELVNEIFAENKNLSAKLTQGKASEVILEARELVWKKYLLEESKFNMDILKGISRNLDTPAKILKSLIKENINGENKETLEDSVKNICGDYSGRTAPYVYNLCLSNTQSRRSRSGSTFQSIVYRIYRTLGYPFESQKKVGKKVFNDAGLGKIVDSIIPGLDAFMKKRRKTIIGTMKTSLRERWQEVVEEIQRTNIPEIYLLTVDDEITFSKAQQMGEHNVTIVVPEKALKNKKLSTAKNMISFEEYLYKEIPDTLKDWN